MDLMRVVMNELFARSAEQTTHNKTVGDEFSTTTGFPARYKILSGNFHYPAYLIYRNGTSNENLLMFN